MSAKILITRSPQLSAMLALAVIKFLEFPFRLILS